MDASLALPPLLLGVSLCSITYMTDAKGICCSYPAESFGSETAQGASTLCRKGDRTRDARHLQNLNLVSGTVLHVNCFHHKNTLLKVSVTGAHGSVAKVHANFDVLQQHAFDLHYCHLDNKDYTPDLTHVEPELVVRASLNASPPDVKLRASGCIPVFPPRLRAARPPT